MTAARRRRRARSRSADGGRAAGSVRRRSLARRLEHSAHTGTPPSPMEPVVSGQVGRARPNFKTGSMMADAAFQKGTSPHKIPAASLPGGRAVARMASRSLRSLTGATPSDPPCVRTRREAEAVNDGKGDAEVALSNAFLRPPHPLSLNHARAHPNRLLRATSTARPRPANGPRPPRAVVVSLRNVGAAPALKQSKFKIEAEKKFGAVIAFLRAQLRCKDSDSLVRAGAHARPAHHGPRRARARDSRARDPLRNRARARSRAAPRSPSLWTSLVCLRERSLCAVA